MSIVKEMLKNEDIKGWYHEMLFSGAEITITTYLRRLSAILKQMNETPESFINMSPEDRYEKMLNYALEEQKRGRAPSYIVSEFKAIYSFLKYKGVYFKRIPNPKKPCQHLLLPMKQFLILNNWKEYCKWQNLGIKYRSVLWHLQV